MSCFQYWLFEIHHLPTLTITAEPVRAAGLTADGRDEI